LTQSHSPVVEVVRGRLDRTRANELLAFWAARHALAEDEARRRLPEVVCALRLGGELVGACSVYAAEVPLIGRRRFWIYRSLLDPVVADQALAMMRAAFDALESGFDRAPDSPIGLCALIAGAEERRRRPEAVWSDPPMVYAGYLGDGRQVRIAYFGEADIDHTVASVDPTHVDWSLPDGYRVDPFAAQNRVSAEDVIELWLRERVLSPAEARRRVSEVLLVATDPQGRPVGVSTTYLSRSEQLRADLWHTRVFVVPAHQRSGIGFELALVARATLEDRFVSGIDRRGIGVVFVVENEMLQRSAPHAVWPSLQFIYIGQTPNAGHVRVYYFPGAHAPEPAQGSA
jgi:GNAT superfamily N-acetyltransferase